MLAGLERLASGVPGAVDEGAKHFSDEHTWRDEVSALAATGRPAPAARLAPVHVYSGHLMPDVRQHADTYSAAGNGGVHRLDADAAMTPAAVHGDSAKFSVGIECSKQPALTLRRARGTV